MNGMSTVYLDEWDLNTFKGETTHTHTQAKRVRETDRYTDKDKDKV